MIYTVFQFIQGSFNTGFTVELQGKKSFWPETKKKHFQLWQLPVFLNIVKL